MAAFETLIAANLTHPALAAPLATGISGVSAFLVQDYVGAESLDLAVREYGAAPAGDAIRVATQLAGALDVAADASVVHGALHPRDILLSTDDTRLTGVGVARALAQAGVTAPVRRPYTAPERIDGGNWDRRADIFSLAALIFELLSGRRIAGTGLQAVDGLAEIAGSDLEALRATFARALDEDPNARFVTALEFVESLQTACAGVVDAASVASRPPPAKKRASRKAERGDPAPSVEPPAFAPSSEAELRPGRPPFEPTLPLLALAEPEPASAHPTDRELRPGGLAREPASAHSPERELRLGRPVIEPVIEPPAVGDYDLNRAEEARYADVETAPAFAPSGDAELRPDRPAIVDVEVPRAVMPEPVAYVPPVRMPAGLITGDPEPLSALERSRSAVWPLVLALGVGVAIGFGGGYFVGAQQNRSAAVTARPAGKEFTENAVAAAPEKSQVASPKSQVENPEPPGAAPDSRPATRDSRLPNPEPRVPNPVVGPGRLLVRSTPAGAIVTVDGKEYGRTPATVRELAIGPHEVTVARAGYAASDRRIVLTRARPAQAMTFALEKGSRGPAAAFAGALTVDSRPAGAKVFLDGKLVGSTPLSLQTVAAGEHAIRLERDGYRRWTSQVRIVAGEQNRVTASLER